MSLSVKECDTLKNCCRLKPTCETGEGHRLELLIFLVRDRQPGFQPGFTDVSICLHQFAPYNFWTSAVLHSQDYQGPKRCRYCLVRLSDGWSGMWGMRAAKSFFTSGTFHSKQTATSKIIESLGMTRYDLKSSSGFPAFSSCVTGRCMLKLPSPVHGEPRGCKYGLAQCGSCLSHLS